MFLFVTSTKTYCLLLSGTFISPSPFEYETLVTVYSTPLIEAVSPTLKSFFAFELDEALDDCSSDPDGLSIFFTSLLYDFVALSNELAYKPWVAITIMIVVTDKTVPIIESSFLFFCWSLMQ